MGAEKLIEKPIFILGSGRSGTTILYELLAMHPDVYWFSKLTNAFPMMPVLSALDQIQSAFTKNRLFYKENSFFSPVEGEKIYKWCGFIDGRRSFPEDVSISTRRKFLQTVFIHQKMTGKRRFLNKRTSNIQRLLPLAEMFPDAYWIHIIRDGRAVVHSLLEVDWWQTLPLWWLGISPLEWEKTGKDPLQVCALHWKYNVTEVLRCKPIFGKRYLQISYEDLIADPQKIIAKICRFCFLNINSQYINKIPLSLPNMNAKWKKDFTSKQLSVIEKEAGSMLSLLGYK